MSEKNDLMYSLIGKTPNEWEIVNFENANITIIDGDRGDHYPKQNEFVSEGYCLFLNANNVTKNGFRFNNVQFISFEKDSILRKGKLLRLDIVLTTRGTVGNMAFYDDQVLYDNIRINSGMVLLRNNDENLLHKYFFLSFSLFYFPKQYNLLKSGSAQPQLPIKDLKDFFFLKPPLPEQTKIAEILTTIDEAIERTDAIIAKRKRIKEGLMHDLFRYGLDEYGKLRNETTHKFKDSLLGRIPEEWEVVEVKDIVPITTGDSDTQDKNEDGIYPFYVRSQIVEKSNRYIFDGEGVLTSGDGVGVGKIYHHAQGKFDYHQRVYLMYDFKKSNSNGKFFFEYFKNNFLKEVSKYSAKTTVDSVRLHMIANMLFIKPKYEEQSRIASIFTTADKAIEKEETYRNKLQAQKRGLMEDLLTGKVRVNHLIKENAK